LAIYKKESEKKSWIPNLMGKNFIDGVLAHKYSDPDCYQNL